MSNLPEIYSTKTPDGQSVEIRKSEHLGVQIFWSSGSADHLIAFVEGLPDEERRKLRMAHFEEDWPGAGPVIMAHWTSPPPWRFRFNGEIPPKIADLYPSMHAIDGKVWRPGIR